MAEVSTVSDQSGVPLLILLAEVSAELRHLSHSLRTHSEVQLVDRRTDIEAGSDGPSVEWYVDAELSNGEALSWRLLLYWRNGLWHIESGVSRINREGTEIEAEFPGRSADASTLGHELNSATSQLVRVIDQVRFS